MILSESFRHESLINLFFRAYRSTSSRVRAFILFHLGFFSASSSKPIAIGKGFRSLNSRLIRVSKGFSCGLYCRIEAYPPTRKSSPFFSPIVNIGHNVSIGDYFHLGASNSVIIGSDVLIGSNVLITDHSHGSPSSDLKTKNVVPPGSRPIISKGHIVIESNVWICDGAKILPGAHIGYGSIISANAVVRSKVPPFIIF